MYNKKNICGFLANLQQRIWFTKMSHFKGRALILVPRGKCWNSPLEMSDLPTAICVGDLKTSTMQENRPLSNVAWGVYDPAELRSCDLRPKGERKTTKQKPDIDRLLEGANHCRAIEKV